MRDWAFATSPYGLGLTTERAWQLTPREIRALVSIYEGHLQRWALGIIDFRNVHFHKKSGPWTIDDILNTSGSAERKRVEQRELADMQRIQMAEKKQIREIRDGTFDDSWLPAGIRMTDAERAARQKRAR